jgi:hypothetical protein
MNLSPLRVLPAPVALATILTSAAVAQVVADTTFSVDRGLHSTPFVLAISTTTPGATIRYTLDCSDPRTSPLFAQGPSPLLVTIDPTSTNGGLRPLTPGVVVRAYAFAPGLTPTNVDTVTYVFPQRVLTQTRPAGFTNAIDFDVDQAVVTNPLYASRFLPDLAAVPTMSVVGNYTQMFGVNGVIRATNGSIEVPGSIEVMHPDGRDDQVDCGLTPHSWIQNKRSIRVYFRSLYGADKWRHDLFRGSAEGAGIGITSFDNLVLRAGFNDGILYNEPARAGRYSFAVDELGRSSQIAMTGFGPRGRFVHLYVNGLYWGLYNPVERPESSFWSDTFGGSKDDYFARNHGGTIDGSPVWWNGLIASAATCRRSATTSSTGRTAAAATGRRSTAPTTTGTRATACCRRRAACASSCGTARTAGSTCPTGRVRRTTARASSTNCWSVRSTSRSSGAVSKRSPTSGCSGPIASTRSATTTAR